jgi:cyclophilin family peptidyl-prolyl cis-trans isomerase
MRRQPTTVAALLAVGLLAGCGGSKAATTSTVADTSTAAGAGAAQTTTGAAAPAARGCTTVPMPPLAARTEPKPTTKLDPGKTYVVTFVTNCGSFAFRLDQAESPNASASFVSLVLHGYFTKTIFHRIVPGFVIQGGDPTGTGTGGPGYTTVDRPPATAAYTLGVVAMAKTAQQPRGTAGSQFFVVTVPNAGLPPDYAIIGKVTSGLAVVLRIGRLGNQLQQPTQVVEIEQATVKVS